MSLHGVLADNQDHNGDKGGFPIRWQDQFTNTQRDLKVQLIISVAFGLSAFLAFCVLRPRWTELYHARKKQTNAASRLPELPDSLFGWIPVLYRISHEEVLASAGLDAYAFLTFFRYAIKYLSITLFFVLTVILPVNYHYTGEGWPYPANNGTVNATSSEYFLHITGDTPKLKKPKHTEYLWMYVAFCYFFTAVAFYLLIVETKGLIRVRQAYLGTQATVTDRTVRLSGVPAGLRSEEAIKDFIEDLGIGKVDAVMLCRNWCKLDDLIDDRMSCLRRLEAAWAVHLGHHHSSRQTRRAHKPPGRDGDGAETTALMSSSEIAHAHVEDTDRPRPQHTIRSGPLDVWGHKVDAISHWEGKLKKLDDSINLLRKEEFTPTALAFVTMESAAACQMAVQAILDPSPGQLIATPAPPPADIVWKNTYLSRNSRMFRSWGIMIIIAFLTIFWSALLVPLAGLLSIEAIDEVLPGLSDALEAHGLAKTLVQASLPTLFYSLLSVGVPYLYYWLSDLQGYTSQGDVELSVISKNFFFQFFNLFLVFSIWGSAANFNDFWNDLKDVLKDTTGITYAIARSLEQLSPFYVNLLVLQGFGLFPFRLLEFGSVALYPFYLIGAKTPRDHAELSRPPVFTYGFYLPQAMLIFIICIVYSVLPAWSWMISLFGLVYFLVGSFIYKYQLLYAMDHPRHTTGRAWPMICNRIILGLVVFQIAMTGIVALRSALTQAVFMLPLLIATIWFTVYFQRTYFPLMTFIALRSIDRYAPPPEITTPPESTWDRDTDYGRAVDTEPSTGLRYMNPNLTAPLEALWLRKRGQGREPQTV